ncbi:MAG: BatA domain-containing protein, partial [Burkholderiaceae bacterium]
YLFKPRPIEKTIPSLLFFINDPKQSKKSFFLRRLLTNIVFLLQLLALLALAFSLTEPFITLTKTFTHLYRARGSGRPDWVYKAISSHNS